jgi:integrase
MASIQRIVSPLTKEVTYRAQVRVRGRPSESATFPNRKEAQTWASSVESAIREGRHFPQSRARRTAFDELVARYRGSMLSRLSEGEQSHRNRHLDWWQERFAGLSIGEITADRVAEARDALAGGTFTRGKVRKDKDGKEIPPTEYKRSGATANRYLATLSHLLSTAKREWRVINANPVEDISRKKESRGRTRFLSDDERARLLDACSKSDWPALHTLVQLAILTGARRGELIGLKWADVDLRDGKALVSETKNGESRVLPLAGKALESLRSLKLQNSARSESVFPNASCFPGPYEHFDAHWQTALETAEIKDCRFHDLRHTTASYLAAQGASLLEIADVLGHKTLAMVKRYSHLVTSHKATVIEKMARERGL